MFIFEESISGEKSLSLNDYINNKVNTVPLLNTQCVIKVNNQIIKRDNYSTTILHVKDKITVLPLLGGG